MVRRENDERYDSSSKASQFSLVITHLCFDLGLVEAPQPEKQPQNQSEHQPRNKPEKPPESPVEQPAEKLVSPPNVASNRTSTIKKAETSTPVSAGGTQLLSRKEMRLMVQTAVRERKGGKRGQANAVKDPKEADKDEGTGLAARLRKLVGGWL
jgi:outer membrane biosynthesis protein TonB